MNDGDIKFFDKDDPECPPNTAVQDAVWFTKSNIEQSKQDWRERAGYPDGLWADINQPWWSNTGFQARKDRWQQLAEENESKYTAPFYTKTFWEEWKYKLAENIGNDFYEQKEKEKTAA